MLGHKQIIALRRNNSKPKGVFFFARPEPKFKKDWQNPEYNIVRGELPDVYAGDSSAKKADLTWVKGLTIHLIADTKEDFLEWWIALVEAKPKLLLGIDWDGELNEWKA